VWFHVTPNSLHYLWPNFWPKPKGKFNLIPILSARKPIALSQSVAAESPQQVDEENRKHSFLLPINCRASSFDRWKSMGYPATVPKKKATKTVVLESLLILEQFPFYMDRWAKRFQSLLSSHNRSLSVPCHFLLPSWCRSSSTWLQHLVPLF
jgi:hypothetical protein